MRFVVSDLSTVINEHLLTRLWATLERPSRKVHFGILNRMGPERIYGARIRELRRVLNSANKSSQAR